MKYFNSCKKNFILQIIIVFQINSVDLTIIGSIWPSDGLGKIAINLIEALKDDLTINWKSAQNQLPIYEDLSLDVKKIIDMGYKESGKVSLLTDIPWCRWSTLANNVPNDSIIKIAYSMLEANKIPKEWVDIFNNNFDIIVVPDDYYKIVYNKSGIKIPIFVLPMLMNLDKFLNIEIKTKKNTPFVFGNISSVWPHKNIELLIRAFGKAFGKDQNVELIINTRHVSSDNHIEKVLKKK